MSNTSTLSGIIRARAMSCCFLWIETSAASSPCDVGKDWVGCCAITIKRQRDHRRGFCDDMGHADKADRVRTAEQSGDQGTRRVSAGRGRARKSDGFLHFRRLHLRGALWAQYHHALGMAALGLGPGARRATSGVFEREAGETHSEPADRPRERPGIHADAWPAVL